VVDNVVGGVLVTELGVFVLGVQVFFAADNDFVGGHEVLDDVEAGLDHVEQL